MRTSALFIVAGTVFLAACSNTGDSSKDTSSGGNTCETTIKSQYPDPADPVDYRTVVEWTLSEADSTASVDAPVAGSTVVSEDGKTITFTPDSPLDPSTEYSFTLNYCGGSSTDTFTTSDVGTAVNGADLIGSAYLVDLANAEITDPPGVGSLLSSYLTVGILVGVEDYDSGSNKLTMVGAVADDTMSGQDYCTPTITFPQPADFSSNPYFEISGDSVPITVQGVTVELQDLKIGGSFAPDGSQFSGGTLEGTVDTYAIDDVMEYDHGQVCSVVSSLGVSCVACADGSGDHCLSIKARDITADKLDMTAIVPIEGSDCVGCTTGVPMDTSEGCDTGV